MGTKAALAAHHLRIFQAGAALAASDSRLVAARKLPKYRHLAGW
jgi:hypothetical protein